MVGGKPEEFTANTIPTPGESVFESIYDFHDQLLFGKIIEPEDVRYMIRNIPWTSGTKYDIYDDKDPALSSKNYYVISAQPDGSYGVFKCIYKNPVTDPESVIRPDVNQVSPDDEIYITGDGYHWKYMYTISSVLYDKFATTSHVPIVIDAEVVANSVPGTIDAIQLESVGAQYNNYASGTIKEAAVGGDTLKFSLNSDDFFTVNTYDIVYTGNGVFTEGETVDITVPGSSAVEGEIYKTGTASISIIINANTEAITQATVDIANGYITVSDSTANTTANVIRIREENLPNLSNDNNFYKNSVIYIRNGTGAGQIKDIDAYNVIGNDRIITVESAFSILPDRTSTFSILPKIDIKGDGSGAIAIPVIETTANSIINVQVLNRGSGYTFATSTVIGNTGIIDSNGDPIIANTAVLRPILAPQGGHGSDPIEELYGINIGISTTFANSEVLDNVSYSKIGLVRNLLHNNVQLTLDSLANGDFTVGETIRQEDPNTSSGLSKARGEVSNINVTSNILTLTNVLGVFEVSSNNQIIGSSANATVTDINRDISTFNNEISLLITPISGSFQVGEIVTQNNSEANGYVVSANSTIVNVVKVFGEFSNNISNIITGGTSDARAIVSSVSDRKLVDNSGDVIYIENTEKITRSNSTSEQVKLVIKF